MLHLKSRMTGGRGFESGCRPRFYCEFSFENLFVLPLLRLTGLINNTPENCTWLASLVLVADSPENAKKNPGSTFFYFKKSNWALSFQGEQPWSRDQRSPWLPPHDEQHLRPAVERGQADRGAGRWLRPPSGSLRCSHDHQKKHAGLLWPRNL